MFSKFFSKKDKRKSLTVKESYFDNSISDKDKKVTLKLISVIDSFIAEIEKFANSGDSSLQNKLKDEQHIDKVKAELLILTYRYFDHSARYAKEYNPEIGNIVYSAILDYIDTLSIKFPTENYKDSQHFFEERLPSYSEFFTFFLSTSSNADIDSSLTWLLSVVSIRPLTKLAKNELKEAKIYAVDFDIENSMIFGEFFIKTFNPIMKKMDTCFN
jgi:hypothetical protein